MSSLRVHIWPSELRRSIEGGRRLRAAEGYQFQEPRAGNRGLRAMGIVSGTNERRVGYADGSDTRHKTTVENCRKVAGRMSAPKTSCTCDRADICDALSVSMRRKLTLLDDVLAALDRRVLLRGRLQSMAHRHRRWSVLALSRLSVSCAMERRESFVQGGGQERARLDLIRLTTKTLSTLLPIPGDPQHPAGRRLQRDKRQMGKREIDS